VSVVKIVTLFLVVIAVLALFGKLRMPKLPGPARRMRMARPATCRQCGSPIVGKGPCPCETPR
jgi:hypothetical protein